MPVKRLGELSGILTWALQGCLAGQRKGMGLPAAIKAETRKYIAEQDRLRAFIADECFTGQRDIRVKASVLHEKYMGWCSARVRTPALERKFGEMIDDIEGVKKKSSNGIWYHGIMLRPGQDSHERGDLG